MSVSLAAIALVAIILPGYLFTLAYNKTYSNSDPAFPEFSKFTSRAVFSVVLACLFHAVAVPIADRFGGTTVDLDAVILMASGTTDGLALDIVLRGVTTYPYQILTYFLILNVIAFALGVLLRHIVLKNKLDLKFPPLRLENEWFYMLRGLEDDEAEPAYAVVSVDVQQQDSTYIYTGILDRFWIDSNGALERLSLHQHVVRRKLEDDPDSSTVKSTDRNYEIQGEYLVVWCSEIRTLNIDFFYEIDDAED